MKLIVKKITLIALISLTTVSGFAQKKTDKKSVRQAKVQNLMKQEEEGVIIFNKQNAFGAKLNTDGYALFYELGKAKSVVKTNLYWLEIGEHKHPREEKLTNSIAGIIAIGNPFIYGKQNNFYFAKLGFGQQHIIGGKGNKNGVAVSAVYGLGFSAGLLKPYYLNVNNSANQEMDIKYEDNKALFLDDAQINGSSGFTKGFKEMKFVPGAHFRLGTRFDYGRYNDVLSAIEVGVQGEFYSQKMPIMVNSKEKNLFLNAYVSLVLGKRK
jgi:ribosomal protein S24E